jgi:hypothetical protein
LLSLALAGPAIGGSCEDASAPSLNNVSLTKATLIAAGDHTFGRSAAAVALPAHFRIAAVFAPSSDSRIEMVLWLPEQEWNGKFLAVGEDGFLNNPLACEFDPESLLCESGHSEACLTPQQVKSVKSAYVRLVTSAGEFVYPGHAMGFEPAWRMPAVNTAPCTRSIPDCRP